ncbi:MAG: PAS domain S-box protein [Opitutaceae bacterium]|nr:PAS domain S-box protein [Opitutaceae bacterium]
MRRKSRPWLARAAILSLIAAILLVDLTGLVGPADWMFYVVPLVLADWKSRRLNPRLLACICSAMIVVGFFFSPAGVPLAVGAAHRALGIAMLWVVAELLERRRAQDDARRAADRGFRAVIGRVSDAVVALDRDWRFIHVNARAGQVYARRPEELVGRHIWTEFPEGSGQTLRRAYERAMATQQPAQIEEHYPTSGRWLENRIHPSPDGLTIYFYDITERKEAEMLLTCQREVLGSIARGEPLTRALETLVRHLEGLAAGQICTVLLLEPDSQRLRHGAASGLPPEVVRAVDGVAIGPAVGSCGTAAFRRAPVIVEDIATDPLWAEWRAVMLPHGLRACWSKPILDTAGAVLGTFACYSRQPGPPPPAYARIAATATDLAAIAIQRHRESEAVREAAVRIADLYENAPNMLISVSAATGCIVECNATTARITGYTKSELIGKPIVELYDEAEQPRIGPSFARFQATVELRDLELGIRTKDGRTLQMAVNADTVRDAEGRIVVSRSVWHDITGRKRAEEVRQRALSLLNATLESTADGILVVDTAGRVTGFNQQFVRQWRIPEALVATQEDARLLDFVLAQLKAPDAFIAKVRALYSEPDATSFDELEFKDGRVFERYSQPQRLGEASVGRVWSFRDVTERKRAETKLRASEERFHRVFQDSPAGLCMTRAADGTFLEVNESFVRMFEFSRDELIGRRSTDLNIMTTGERAKLMEIQIATGGLQGRESQGRAKSGRMLDLVFSSRPIELGGEACQITTLIDVTERKQAVVALQRSEQAMRELALRLERVREQERTAIAREIHDVLAQELTRLKIDLVWLAKRVRQPIDDPVRSEMTARVGEAIAQADVAISTVQRIATELRPVILDSLGLPAAVEWQVEDFARRSGLECRARVPRGGTALGREGATAIFRILQESLTNVVRHANAAECEVELAETAEATVLTIRDDGIGIKPEQIGDPRAIGLIGMRERVHALGGAVEFSGSPGRGTTVTVRLPLVQSVPTVSVP